MSKPICIKCGIFEATFYGVPTPDGICGTCIAEQMLSIAEPSKEEKILAGLK